jgi:predicted Zn-dependent protease
MPNNASSASNAVEPDRVAKMIEQGESLAELGHFEAAEKFFRKALTLDPNHVELIDLYAETLLDLGEADKAKHFLLKSIERHGDAVAEPYMYMAQLSTGYDALRYLQHGIHILEQQLSSGESDDKEKQSAKLCRAYCNVADLFMTDLCFEPQAEAECERAMEAALRIDPNNAEALQTLASVRISQQRNPDAVSLLVKSVSQWKDAEEIELPYDYRIQTAKLLMEVHQHALAVEVLDRLVQEDAMMLGTWYLLAACHSVMENSEDAFECALYGLKIALSSEYEEDPDLVRQMMELADELKVERSMLDEIPPEFLMRKYGAMIAEEVDDDDDDENNNDNDDDGEDDADME